MPTDPNKLSQFWHELKRRRVVHVTIVYATAAFVIIELINNISEPLKLPEWAPTFVIILLAVGFPVALIFSWIFDVTPEGIQKTPSGKQVQGGAKHTVSSSWRIATYVSMVIILGLIAFNIFGGKRGARIDESLAKSIAVLPFHNYSGDPDQEVICFGLTDEIIGHLYKVRSFDEVRSLTSVLPFGESNQSIVEIARELRVNYILEGSMKRIGDEMRVTAQLIEPESDNHIWIQDYDLLYSKVIGIPAEIAIQIADHLKAFISEDEKQRIEKIPTQNQEAYELIQQANYLSYSNLSFALDSQGLELVLRAVELAPDYADAQAMAGSYIFGLANYGGGKEMKTSGWEGFRYLEKALEIDPDNAAAHYGLATFYEWFRWDYIEAEKNILRALDLLPGDKSMLMSQYGEFLVKRDRMDEAASFYIDESWFYNPYREIIRKIYTGERDAAVRSLERFKERYSESGYYKWIGDIYMRLGQYDSAFHYMEAAVQSGDREMLTVPRHRANLALTCYQLGDTQRAASIIGELEGMSRESSAMSPAFFTGWYFSATGEADSAFYWLEKAYENRSPEMPWLKVDPLFESLKGEDRYRDLYERTGHKAYDEYMASRDP